METLIFILIAAIITILQNKAEKAKRNSQSPQQRQAPSSYSPKSKQFGDNRSDESHPPQDPTFSPARKLQEYIRQFEQAQQEAAQGTLEPPTPPAPEPTHRMGNNVTLREVAEDVILMDAIDVEYLMEEFQMSEGTAISMLAELQQHRIIGHDMGDGECDVLVHDTIELDNLLNREQSEFQKASPAMNASPTSNDKQSQLKILEERARKAREEASEASRQSDIENGYASNTAEASELTQRRVVRSISKESARRGFIWGKIIDEPRFKRRWSPAHR